MTLNLTFTADIEPTKNCYKTFSLGGLFLNNTIIRKCSKESNIKYLLFGNIEREFVTSLQKQPKNKGKDMLLSLIKKKRIVTVTIILL